MKTKQAIRVLCGSALVAVSALAAGPAMAQAAIDASGASAAATDTDISSDASVTAPKKNVFEGNHVTIGVGAVYGPSYDGSNDMVVTPFPAIQARIGGIDINPRPGGIALDLIPTPHDAKIGFNLGPVVTITRNRVSQIKDPVVRAAGKLKTGINLGANAGVTAYRVLNPYDQLTISSDIQWDVNGASGGMQISPNISYLTPLSKAMMVVLNVGARHVDDDYARYYYSVNAAQSASSGLPLYNAKGGWDSWHAGILMGYDLSGDLRDGGFQLFLFGNYKRMLNDASATPYTSIRGNPNQWLGGVGVGYTF